MSDRFLFVYLMTEQPDRIEQVAVQHAGYWNGLDLPGYLGGPLRTAAAGRSASRLRTVSKQRDLWPAIHSWWRICSVRAG